MRIDPRRLLDLLAIAKYGTISAAAEALNVSQPGLSQSVAQLEHGLGVKVLDRDRHGARLTEFGRVLVFHARALEALLARAKEETRLHALGIEGPLAVGITPVSAASLVPQALALLLEEAPKIAVSLVEGLDDDLVGMLRGRELDLVVSRLRPGLDGVISEPLIASDWALITHPKHPLAQRTSVRLAEIQEERWVVPAGGSAFRRQMEVVFETAGVPWPSTGISTNSILAIKAIVMNTEGVTIMSPALVDVERQAGRVHVVPLQEGSLLQPVGMMWRSNDEPSRAAARFAKFLRLVAVEATAAEHAAAAECQAGV